MTYSSKTKLDTEAYERDDYRCVKCSRKEGIEAHHVIPELETLDNLMTLCHRCHKKEHNMAGCFKQGFDDKRKIHSKEWMVKINSKNPKNFRNLGRYYNRWQNKWMPLKNT